MYLYRYARHGSPCGYDFQTEVPFSLALSDLKCGASYDQRLSRLLQLVPFQLIEPRRRTSTLAATACYEAYRKSPQIVGTVLVVTLNDCVSTGSLVEGPKKPFFAFCEAAIRCGLKVTTELRPG